MQKNLLIKLVIIVGILLAFLYGIFGIPSSLTGDGLKAAVLKNIHLGLDLNGGTHLILQVQVNDAVDGASDRAVETLKDQFGRARITYGDIGKPDPGKADQIVIKGVPLNAISQVRGI